MFSSDVDEDTRSDVPIPSLPRYDLRSQSMQSLALDQARRGLEARRRTVHVSEERFDSLEEKMIGIQEALARTSSCVEMNKDRVDRARGGDESLVRQLRKE